MASSSESTLTSAPPTFVTASGPAISHQQLTLKRGPDVLDKTVTFLAKRDGIDKVSVLQYSTVPAQMIFSTYGLPGTASIPLTQHEQRPIFMMLSLCLPL